MAELKFSTGMQVIGKKQIEQFCLMIYQMKIVKYFVAYLLIYCLRVEEILHEKRQKREI